MNVHRRRGGVTAHYPHHALLPGDSLRVGVAGQRGVDAAHEGVQDVQAGHEAVELQVLLVDDGRGEYAVAGQLGHGAPHRVLPRQVNHRGVAYATM
jgi:hypothetical protein